MAIKESSDELNPTTVAPSAIVTRSGSSRTAKDFFALAVSTCGVGYLPLAPGTWGSLVGVALYLLFWSLSERVLFADATRPTLLEIGTPQMAFMLTAIFLLSMAGIWAASRVERLSQRKDPSIVVIDEVAGQMIALLPGPFFVHTWWSIISAFVLFRAFDIWKPYPIRQLERLESGLGIMADDIVAGIYAVIVNTVLVSAYLLFLSGGR